MNRNEIEEEIMNIELKIGGLVYDKSMLEKELWKLKDKLYKCISTSKGVENGN